MVIKDYYTILQIPVSASDVDIKKAYRKLAVQFHPDKHKDEKIFALAFLEIQEAYGILKDKVKRAAYDIQYYTITQQNRFKHIAENAEEVLQASIQLQKEMVLNNPFRLDIDYVSFQIKNTLSDHQLYLMKATTNQKIRNQFIENMMGTLHFLPFPKAQPFLLTLKGLSINDEKTSEKINRLAFQLQWKYYWNTYKIYFALFLAIALCLIIYSSK